MKKLFLIAAIITLLGSAVSWGRQWRDSTGKHTIEAEFVEIVDAQDHSLRESPAEGKEIGRLFVRLKKQDGQVITVPLAKLSEEDQQFVKSTYSQRDEERQPVHGNSKPKSAGLTRVSLPQSASTQLDNAIVEGVEAYVRAEDASQPGMVTIYMGRGGAKPERLEITIAGKGCEVSHNWNWHPSLMKRALAPAHWCPRPSGSIRLTALTDLPLDGITVAAGSVLIRSGSIWVVVKKGEDAATRRNDIAGRDKNDQEHAGIEAAQRKPRSKAGEQEQAQPQDAIKTPAQAGGKPNGVPKEPMPKTVRHLMSLVRQEQVNAQSGERFDVFMAGMAQFGEIYQAVLRVVEDHNGETAMSELARVIGEKQGSSKARDRLVYDKALWALSCFCDPEKDFDKDVAMVAETLRDHCNPRVAEKAIAELDKKYGKNSPGWKTGRKAHGG